MIYTSFLPNIPGSPHPANAITNVIDNIKITSIANKILNES
jgi:hypothetical protein